MSTEEPTGQASFAKKLDITMEGQKSSGKIYRLEDVAQHADAQDLWIAIHNKVYDITKFLEEHPGGLEVLLENAGQEATYAFEDVGHSLDARDLLSQYYIGDLHQDDRTEKAATAVVTENNGSSTNLLVVLGVAALAAISYYMFTSRA